MLGLTQFGKKLPKKWVLRCKTQPKQNRKEQIEFALSQKSNRVFHHRIQPADQPAESRRQGGGGKGGDIDDKNAKDSKSAQAVENGNPLWGGGCPLRVRWGRGRAFGFG